MYLQQCCQILRNIARKWRIWTPCSSIFKGITRIARKAKIMRIVRIVKFSYIKNKFSRNFFKDLFFVPPLKRLNYN